MRVRGVRRHRAWLGALVVCVSTAAGPARAGPATIEGSGCIGGPLSPQSFADAWGRGLGIGGALGVGIGRAALLLHGEFVQFAFEGSEGLGAFGGERRFSTLMLVLRVPVWQHESLGAEAIALTAGGGWGHESIAGTFGEGDSGVAADVLGDGSDDGVAWSAAVEFSRSLYRTTRWAIGLRYNKVHLSRGEAPAAVMLVLGMRMPLTGARPR